MKELKEVAIRTATAGDADALIELGIRTFNDAFAHLNSPEDMNAYLSVAFTREQLLSELEDPKSTFLIAESDGRAIAYSKLYRGEAPDVIESISSIELARLYVDKQMHGRGVSHDLMKKMLELTVSESFKTIWLGVWEHNERAK